MTLALAIAVNVFAVLALVSVLAYVMSRAARLSPHAPGSFLPVFRPIQVSRGAPARRTRRAESALAGARS